MSRKPCIPTYRLHKQSGQAVVILPDGFGGRRDILLGPHDSPESRQFYDRTIAEWMAKDRRLEPSANSKGLSLNELILADWKHAEACYGFEGSPRGDAYCNLAEGVALLISLVV